MMPHLRLSGEQLELFDQWGHPVRLSKTEGKGVEAPVPGGRGCSRVQLLRQLSKGAAKMLLGKVIPEAAGQAVVRSIQ